MSIIPGIENAAPERTETSRGFCGVAEALAGLLFDLAQALDRLLPHPFGEVLAALVEGVARLGGDDEARRDGQPRPRHLAQPRALAAEQRARVAAPLVEQVDPLVFARPRHRRFLPVLVVEKMEAAAPFVLQRRLKTLHAVERVCTFRRRTRNLPKRPGSNREP